MSRRIHSWLFIAAIGSRTSRVEPPMEIVRRLRCIRFDMTRRCLSQRVTPRQSSIHLEKSLWRLANITRTVRKYLGAGENYTALLESHPTRGTIGPQLCLHTSSMSQTDYYLCSKHSEGRRILEVSLNDIRTVENYFSHLRRSVRCPASTSINTKDLHLDPRRCTLSARVNGLSRDLRLHSRRRLSATHVS